MTQTPQAKRLLTDRDGIDSALIQPASARAERPEEPPTLRQNYAEQLRKLRLETKRDVGLSSAKDFWLFFGANPDARQASLGVSDDGNVRADWRTDWSNQVSIEFLGGGKTNFVVFERGEGLSKVECSTGRGDLESAISQVTAFEATANRQKRAAQWLANAGGSQPELEHVVRRRSQSPA